MRRVTRPILAVLVLLMTGCVMTPSPSPSMTATPAAATPTPPPTGSPPASAAPTATPEPLFSLGVPAESDDRAVTIGVAPDLDGDRGELLVTVTSQADTRIDELVLRWSRDLGETFRLAPFVPSEERIRDGGPPLVQAWTKWVVGPGEQGEPAGTISLGYGPLMPGATLTMPLNALRLVDGPIAFDLQVLARNAILATPDGEPAEIRVEVP